MKETKIFKMDDVDDKQQREQDAKKAAIDNICCVILYLFAAIMLAVGIIMLAVDLYYIEYGRGLAFTWV